MEILIKCQSGEVVRLEHGDEWSIEEHLEDGKEGTFFIALKRRGEIVARLAEDLPTKKKSNWLMFRIGTELNRAGKAGGGTIDWDVVRRPAKANPDPELALASAWARLLGPSALEGAATAAVAASDGVERVMDQLSQNVVAAIEDHGGQLDGLRETAGRHLSELTEFFLLVIQAANTLHEKYESEWLDAERSIQDSDNGKEPS